MNDCSLVYFGPYNESDFQLLKSLEVIEFRPQVAGIQRGLYIFETKFGKTLQISASTTFSSTAEAWIITRYLSHSELELLRNTADKKIYLLAHNFINFDYLLNELAGLSDRIIVFVQNNSDYIKAPYFDKLKKNFKNSVLLKKFKPKQENSEHNFIMRLLNYFYPLFAIFVKLMLSPINELNKYSTRLRYSNLRVFRRLIELFLFLDYLFKYIVFIPVLYFSIKLIGFNKIFVIRFLYLIRHVCFVSYGKLVDTFYLLVRVAHFFHRNFIKFYNIIFYKGIYKVFIKIKSFIEFILYKVIYFIYFKIIYYIYFNILFYLYNKIIEIVWYRVIYTLYFNVIFRAAIQLKLFFEYLYFNFLLPALVRIKLFFEYVLYRIIYYLYYQLMLNLFYKTRHLFLVNYFKLTGEVKGRSIDLVYFIHRLFKLYLLYPFFKIYWFFSFQYKKRIKKVIK